MKKILFFASALFIMASCDNAADKHDHDEDGHSHDSAGMHDQHAAVAEDSIQVLSEKNGIKIAYLEESPTFPDAKLSYIKPDVKNPLKEGKTLFQYKVEDFQLTMQTSDAEHKHTANSHQGQHIHQILNNEPYTAHYTDTFSKVLKPGHYVNLSFLSRSYHESLKHKSAYTLNQFTVGSKKEKDVDLNAPHLFYSRPKGEYAGTDTKKLLLDFYLVNTELSETGNKVRATINGTEFILTKWAPYAIYGLPMGENTIKLELLDKDNKVITGPFNTVERKITLKAE
ncbi:MAG: hypothetical protein ACXWDO_10630 [Bacteroidia bacterium]